MNTDKEERTESVRARLIRRLRFGLQGRRGFTIIELLVVIIIIAILTTIAIPTYMGQREHAQDAAAYSLVRDSLTAVQGAFIDTNDYSDLTASGLNSFEPSIHFVQGGSPIVDTSPAAISGAITAAARNHEVQFYAESANVIELATRSDSGNLFGIRVNAIDLSNSGYVKVKVVDGSAGLGW
jgi:type IV pilus assembly protein PilA